MSSDSQFALRLEGIGKQYRLGATTGGAYKYTSLREAMGNPFRRSAAPPQSRDFWALRNVSFSVSPGERVGVIGRNGAGKSTLLKVLSRVTTPTEGRAEIRGRVGSLLEVGTGFHPELSGRDNITLNGAILGMGRREIKQKTDEIVVFAGVEQFLSTPVKRYSSGMYLRLAFAVAAHLDPDVLLVDEVLAVGDADFQKKCLGRMEEISSTGRTVVFISHSMPSILRLCNRVVLLDHGGVIADGASNEVVRTYLDTGLGSTAERTWEDPDTAPGDDVVRLKSIRVLSHGLPCEAIDIGQPIDLEVEYSLLRDDLGLRPAVTLNVSNEDGITLFVTSDFNNRSWWSTPRARGAIKATCRLPGNFLAEGRHMVWVAVSTFNPTVMHGTEEDAVSFQIVDHSSGDGVRGEFTRDWPGVVRPMLNWTVESIPPQALRTG